MVYIPKYLPPQRVGGHQHIEPTKSDIDFAIERKLLATEIETVFHQASSDWIQKGVLEYDKNHLQTLVLKDQLPIFKEIHYSKYNVEYLPEFVYNRFLMESADSCGYTREEETEHCKWLHVYEASRPIYSLLLMAVTKILLENHVIRRLLIPKSLKNTHDFKQFHYAFLNARENVESINIIRLDKDQFDKDNMIRKFSDVINNDGIISSICRHFIGLPVFDTMANKFVTCHSAPPLGEITRCLNHILYQNVFDKIVSDKYPWIIYSRWDNEIVVLNEYNSLHKFHARSLLKELNLKADYLGGLYASNEARFERKNIIYMKDRKVSLYLNEKGNLQVQGSSRSEKEI